MIAAISFFIILCITVLISRIATIALTHTGLSQETARFQVRSALTGSGFTTDESELVVSHPVRRKIIFMLFLVGNAGFITVASSLILTFVIPENTLSMTISIGIVFLGLVIIWWVTHSKFVDRFLSKVIHRALKKYTHLNLGDYASILRLRKDYQITEFQATDANWIIGKSLHELNLPSEGILVLGIQRNEGTFLGAPEGDTQIMGDDLLTMYGKASSIESLNKRKKGYEGDREHYEAVSKHEQNQQEQRQRDEAAADTVGK